MISKTFPFMQEPTVKQSLNAQLGLWCLFLLCTLANFKYSSLLLCRLGRPVWLALVCKVSQVCVACSFLVVRPYLLLLCTCTTPIVLMLCTLFPQHSDQIKNLFGLKSVCVQSVLFSSLQQINLRVCTSTNTPPCVQFLCRVHRMYLYLYGNRKFFMLQVVLD